MRYDVGKNRNCSKEYTREQKLANENKALKKELAHLRKQIQRIDLDRYDTVSKMCSDYQEKERFEEQAQESNNGLEQLKKTWACHTPGCEGYLEIVCYPKMGTTWYFRTCALCKKRTISQRFDSDNVKGIFKK